MNLSQSDWRHKLDSTVSSHWDLRRRNYNIFYSLTSERMWIILLTMICENTLSMIMSVYLDILTNI